MTTFAIKRSYGFLEIETSALEDEALQQRMDDLDRAIRELHEAHGFRFICGDTRFLNSRKLSICVCHACDNLMINRDKNPAGFGQGELWRDFVSDANSVIFDGGTHGGKELCMECLPIEHRWGYFS